MESQKTTHILLTIAVVGIFFLIFLYVRDRYFEAQNYRPIVQEESVYIPPTNNPVNPPTTNPTPTTSINTTPTPTTTPTIQQNIPMVVGNNYSMVFGTNSTPYKYCGEKMSDFGEDVASFSYYHFVSAGYDCNVNSGSEVLSINKRFFVAEAKSTTTQDQITVLNNKYGIKQISNNNGVYYLSIKNSNSNYNVYTMAKIYFDSGLFSSTYMKEIYN